MKRIIVCLNNPNQLLIIDNFCQEEKMQMVVINSFDELDDETCVIVITDKEELVSKFKERHRVCFVNGGKLEIGDVFYIKENFNKYHLRMLLDILYHGILVGNYTETLHPTVLHKEYVLENDFSQIDKLVCAITAELVMFFKLCELDKLRVGISEMLTNAMEHGNLGITGEEKFQATEEGTYYTLLEERLKEPCIANRKTRLEIDFRDDTFTCVIKDEGKGFDTSKLPDPTDTEHLLKLHGRGIFITRIYFTEIVYNEIGNQVTLIKKLS